MLPMKKEIQFTISVTVCAIVNFILIKIFGAIGTIGASVIAEFSVTGIQSYYLRKFINVKKYLKQLYVH